MSSHQLSKIAYASITPSKVSGTKKWKTALDKEREELQDVCDITEKSPLYVHQPEPKNFQVFDKTYDVTNFKAFEDERQAKRSEFYERLQQLKLQQEATKKIMERMSNKSYENSLVEYQAEKGECERGKSDEDLDEDDLATPIFCEKRYTDKERCKQKVDQVLEKMWENFNYKDYDISTEQERRERINSQMNMEGRPVVEKKTGWKPVVTVPKPFEMTIREEKKKEVNEKNKEKKQHCEAGAAQEPEIGHRHRAKSAPPTTFIPLLDEIQETQEQRSRENKKYSQEMTMAVQCPFTFDERDRRKREEKERKILEKKQQEERAIRQMSKFRATKLDRAIFESTCYDRLEEDQLYRQIKGRIRREELFLNSTLPPRMHRHHHEEALRREERLEALRRENEIKRMPRSKPAPDFERLHRQEQLRKLHYSAQNDAGRKCKIVEAQRRQAASLTRRPTAKCKSRPSTASSASTGLEKERRTRSRRSSLSRSANDAGCTLPTRMSDTSRRRIESIRSSLHAAQLQLDEAKEAEERKRQKQKKLRCQLAYNITINDACKDPDFELRAEKNKQELRERGKEYQKFLRSVKHRVEKRPLLVNMHDQRLVEAEAERRYQEIIKSTRQCRRRNNDDSTATSDEEEEKAEKRASSSEAAMREAAASSSEYEDDENEESVCKQQTYSADFATEQTEDEDTATEGCLIKSGDEKEATDKEEDIDEEITEEVTEEVSEFEETNRTAGTTCSKKVDFDI